MLSWQIYRNFLFSSRSGALIRTIGRLCVIGIGVGVFSLIVVNSVMNGFHQSIKDRLLKIEPHIVVYFDKDTTETNKRELMQLIHREPDSKKNLRVYEYEEQDVMIRTADGNFSGAVAIGLDSSSLMQILGDLSADTENKKTLTLPPANAALIGRDLAFTMNIYDNDTVVIVPPEALLGASGEIPSYEQVKVAGLLSTSVADVDAKNIYYVRSQTLARLRHSSSYKEGVEIRFADPMQYSDLLEKIKKAGWKAESWVDRNSTMFFALKVEKTVIAVFLGLSTLIASFSIITVLTLLFAQKRREFGVLMAIGLSIRQARKIFSRVGLILAGFGLGIGLLLGVVLSLILQKWPLDVLPKDIYYDSRITAIVDPTMVIIIFLGSCFIAFCAAIIAATQIINTNPIETLRTKVRAQV